MFSLEEIMSVSYFEVIEPYWEWFTYMPYELCNEKPVTHHYNVPEGMEDLSSTK